MSKIDKDAEAKLKTASSDLSNTKLLLREMEGQNKELRHQIDDLLLKAAKVQQTMKMKDGELAELNDEIKKLEDENDDLNAENEKMKDGHGHMQTQHRELQGDVETMKAQRKKMEREAVEVKKHLESIMPFFSSHFNS